VTNPTGGSCSTLYLTPGPRGVEQMIVYSKETRERSSERRMGLRSTISRERAFVGLHRRRSAIVSILPLSLRVIGMTKGGRREAQGRNVPLDGYCLGRLQ